MALVKGFAALAVAITLAHASIENPLILPTPPMGFNDWARFGCDINETLFVETADAMREKGLLAAGYDRINIDDCYLNHTRAENGSLQWNTTLFPNGLIWLGEYVKSKGFHFGIYEDAGNATCGGYPGSLGHEQQDAQTFQDWGVDYLKLDGCNVFPTTVDEYQKLYGKWHQVLTGLSHPMIFSESAPAYFSAEIAETTNQTDWYEVMDWVPLYGELARHSTDIAVYWYPYPASHYWESILDNYHFEVQLARYQQPGYHNDPDFIIVDWPWLTLDEKKSQFALWSSFSAPLIISGYVPGFTEAELEYLTNEDIIAVDQDPLALQATLVSQDGYFDVLTKSLANGDRLLTVLNRGNNTNSTTVSAERMGLTSKCGFSAKDLWTGEETSWSDTFDVSLASHATAIFRMSGDTRASPTGMIFNTASKHLLTAAGSSITFVNSTGADEQVWQISKRGRISPLSAPWVCLTAAANGVSLQRCSSWNFGQRWKYWVTGNLVSEATGLCLTEGSHDLAKCGNELDNQVFALPSGVKVVRNGII